MTPVQTTRRTLLGAVAAAATWWKGSGAAASPLPGEAAVVPPAAVTLEQLTAEVRALADRVQAKGVSLAAFGFKGDGVSDDTLAWRQAIAFAGSKGIRTVLVPAGVSLVNGSIVDAAHPLPPGLTFSGEGTAVDSPYRRRSRLAYAGGGVCWDIAYPIGAPASTGRWAWDGLTFQCTDPTGTMFSFGSPQKHLPSDDRADDPYMFLSGIAFRNVMAFGGSGTGDFLRACKTFHIDIDALSSVYGFRRAFWLNGCDNCRIAARMVGNNRAVMIERSGTFGNNNRIDINYIGGPDRPFGGEPSYSIHDRGIMTTIERGILFEGLGVAAHLFLDGYGTELYSPQLGQGAPFFELGPSAREVAVYSPRCTVISAISAPIVHPAESANFGNSQSDYRMRIVDAPQSIQAIIPAHPAYRHDRRIAQSQPECAKRGGIGRARRQWVSRPPLTSALLIIIGVFKNRLAVAESRSSYRIRRSPTAG